MAQRRTVDLLPEIFRTEPNKQFLSATLDQLTQEPNFVRTQGYVGRRYGFGINPLDNYVVEPTKTRTDYQLEPAVTFLNNGTRAVRDTLTYPGMIDVLKLQGGNVDRPDRLFTSSYYAWDSFCDFDKFSNYSQYYWLPGGPDPVDVATTEIPISDDYTVTRTTSAYSFSGIPGKNPIMTLLRGGNYTFSVNQLGHKFWIQAAPGVAGVMPATPNISSRDVFGVDNNGEDFGTVTFNVPHKTAQDFYYNLTQAQPVDLITSTVTLAQLNNIYVDAFLAANPNGVDGITELNGRTIVFANTLSGAEPGGWQLTTQYDPLVRTVPNQVGATISYDVNGQPYDDVPYETFTNTIISGGPDPLDSQPGSFDSLLYDQVTDIDLLSQRYSVWQINYVYDNDGNPFMRLNSIRAVDEFSKFNILYGTQYNNTQWYKDAEGYIKIIPLLTAALDTLYYQDADNPEIFGQIRLLETTDPTILDINDIVGAKDYVAPNGVIFTNGLKVQFRGPTKPVQYQNLTYYVEGVGTGPGLNQRVGFVDGRAYFGQYHVELGKKVTGATNNGTFQQYIYDTVEESLLNPSSGTPAGAPLPQDSVLGAENGFGIQLIPVSDFITPEDYTRNILTPYDSTFYDVGGYDETLNSPLVPDYITMNRASISRNAWSRSNRWFHIDVINYTSQLNNSDLVVDNDQRAKRPIVELRSDLKLWNAGTEAKSPVNIIDFVETDALSNINGQIGYAVDDYNFLPGTLVIFAADIDSEVRNKIYRVDFINPDGNINSPDIINLVPIDQPQVRPNQQIVSLNGVSQRGLTHWFDGAVWRQAQAKTKVNQAPLFDVFDAQGRSFGDLAVYPSSTFAGNRLFGYAEGGTTIIDPVLGQSLEYLNLNNVGDIVFENFLYTESFLYVQDNKSIQLAVSTGFARQYIDRVSFSNQLGWQTAAAPNRSRQVFEFIANGDPLLLGIPIELDTVFAPVQIFDDGVFVDTSRYTVTVTGTNTTITFAIQPEAGSIIEVMVFSDISSNNAFYQVPLNLSNNAINGNSNQFTLGSIRSHYETIAENVRGLIGPVNGANNIRDLGNITRYGTKIVQHSSPLVLAGTFMRQAQYDLFGSLTFNSREYIKYKARLLDLAAQGDFINQTPTEILDAVTLEVSLPRGEESPFYWSDMLPTGQDYTELTYTYSFVSTNTVDVSRIYDFTSSNYQSLLVYLNGEILTIGYDYTVSQDSATITILQSLAIGDVIKIREYNTTIGNYVPNTPTKLGLYPAYQPAKYIDETYIEPTLVIRGHDGSITVAYGDFRDDVLLEFETRIFNNLKIKSAIPLTQYDVIPGQFRTTDYTLEEITSMLIPDFLSWVGQNRLNYTAQSYSGTEPFTYNYSQSSDRINGEPMLGAWRGIYNYFYDTISPNTTPWEMLGFSQQPNWWEAEYGPAPYTSGNMVLWEDLEAGYIADPDNPRIDPIFARPGLTQTIPSGSEGELLSPLASTVGNYDGTSFRRSWAFGDNGPVENVWRTSSSWPFAVMRLLALTKPAEFFSLFVDRDQYLFDEGLGQYLWDDRYRLEPGTVSPLYGSGTSRASYINWIIDYNQQRGVNSSSNLTKDLSDVDVQLCWRMGGFSDKKYLKIFTERSSPGGLNSSLLLPDESYSVILYANPAFDLITYSSVIVQNVNGGYAVYGYDTLNNYFEIATSSPMGRSVTISAGGNTERVSIEYTDTVVRVPYGFVFNNRNAVCDFLFSYGELLKRRGFEFEGLENGFIMNWQQMAQEFLYWSSQGWTSGSIINLNPAATKISVNKPGAVAESLSPSRPDTVILNQNQQPILPSDLNIVRDGNQISINSRTSNTISYIKMQFTAYEHVLVLDNRSIFADLIYDPVTSSRQNRVLVSGWISGDWNGTVNAPGFVLNQDNIIEWISNVRYTKGQIVKFKDEYWSALTIVQPSAEFNYSSWVRSDYNDVQKGLLPNAANSSNQLAQAYNTKVANLEKDTDLFSYGLIGFRPRQYMSALNLDDVSQVNLYQQFLGTKGTIKSLELFSLANLGKEVAQYDIYEIWAVLSGTYGANANRSYFEIALNQALLDSDPSIVQVIEPGQVSDADQTVLVSDIYNSSYLITSPNILPTTTVTPDNSLPWAGYVNLDDVDVTTFDLTDTNALQNDVSNIYVGTTIWVARSNIYDWNVYICDKIHAIITQVSDNLDATSVVTFDDAHNLAVGDTLIIKEFSDDINGSYIVLSVPSINAVVIGYEFIGLQTTVEGQGLGLSLQTSRVAQPSDITHLPYALDLLPGAKVWVDNNGLGNWEVLEKREPYVPFTTLEPTVTYQFSRFGSSITQGFFNLNAIVGAPGYNPSGIPTPPGGLYTFLRNNQDQYEIGPVVDISTTTGIAGLGNAVEIGDQTWGVAGASLSNNGQGYALTFYGNPGSGVISKRQLLVAPDQNFGPVNFGQSVAISQDERWMYISSPNANIVFAYSLVDVQQQIVSYTASGTTSTFNYSDSIVIDYNEPNQLIVVLEDTVLVDSQNYTVDSTSVTLLTTPTAGQRVLIARRPDIRLDQTTHTNVDQDVTSGLGSDALFTVNNARGVYSVVLTDGGQGYSNGDTITIYGTSVETNDTPATNPTNNITITVTNVDGTGAITPTGSTAGFNWSGTGVGNNASFDVLQYLITAVDIYAFTVRVNDVIQRPHLDYDIIDSTSPYTLTFNTVPPAGADINVSSSSYWKHVDTLTVPGLEENAQFGFNITTNNRGTEVVVGAPNANSGAGRVYVFDRSAQSFIINDATQTQFSTVRDLEVPGSILVDLNGEFLINTNLNIGGQYTVDITDPMDQFVELESGLTQVGDTLTIYTNQFTLTEVIESSTPTEGYKFGFAVDMCLNECSLYASSPYASTTVLDAGQVEFYQNQARLYGTTTTTIANPILTNGDYIRFNNIFVECTGTDVATLVDDIVNANVPNVTASLLPNLLLTGDGTTKTFDVGDIYSAATSYTTKVLLNDVEQTYGVDYTYNNTNQTITFTATPFNTVKIEVVAGRIKISVKNYAASTPTARLNVAPGQGTLFDDLGFETYFYVQAITSPVPQIEANFGYSIYISDDSTTLTVGAPNGDMILPMTFDNGTTTFDSGSERYYDIVNQSGAVYTFDMLKSADPSVSNPSHFVFGQQIVDTTVQSLDCFGQALNYTNNILLVGAPGADLEDSSLADFGKALQYVNASNAPAWQVLRAQQPAVDTSLLNTLYIYDLNTNNKQFFDYFDPLQGKLLGVVEENIDFIGAVDPAAYNNGPLNNFGMQWRQEHVGQIWWDTNRVRFIDPNQNDLIYASRRWGQVFPGSDVQIYQWIASNVPPNEYVGPGTARSINNYVSSSGINDQGIIVQTYYFWVTGIVDIAGNAGKTLSIDTLTQYIESPRTSGISYIAPLSSSALAIYNGAGYISSYNSILYVEFDKLLNDAAIHVEYQLVTQDRPDSFLNPYLYERLLDSLVGENIVGRPVPDPLLNLGQRYGVSTRPRQSMFVDRFIALQNYITRTNEILALYPISEIRSFALLNSAELEPTASSNQWDKRVANTQELEYQNLLSVPLGYRYLVVTDSTQNGLWTIYQVISGVLPGEKLLSLVRVQNYDTRKYWVYIDWYAPTFNPATRIVTTVQNRSDLDTLSLPNGSAVKVSANNLGKWEIFVNNTGTWNRVGLQNGTIEISVALWDYAAARFGFDSEVFDAQYYDQTPTIETRKILEAINTQLLIDDLAINRNKLLVLMFNYALSEQVAPDWLTKTSLIDVDHVIRQLEPFQTYRRDNQDFVLEYINEVKPYHTQIREFNLKYQGQDQFDGDLTDFDVPSEWVPAQKMFISPVLDNTNTLSPTSSRSSTDTVWTQWPYSQWFNNYTLGIESVDVLTGGTGYLSAPEVIVTGVCVTPAIMRARINSAGKVVAVDVVDPGAGYLTTAIITIQGTPGSGAIAVARMGNGLVRSIKTTIRYDRYQYQANFTEWQANTTYNNGTRVRYADRVWQAVSTDGTSSTEFDPTQWVVIDASALSGVDRTMGYYVPTVNKPGLDLALLISGVDYPGVQVSAPSFNQNTGFDVGNYDINPYDNISYGPEGYPTYDPAILDAAYSSSFLDPFLGTRPTDINVSGGAFVDTYESHAPEELIPGITYDTLDFRVYTTPGADWNGQGHGFPTSEISYTFDGSSLVSFAGVLDNITVISVFNQTTGQRLAFGANYTVDWVNYTVEITNGALPNDIVTIETYGLGGGNQLFNNSYVGSAVGSTIDVPIPYALVAEIVAFVNGVNVNNFSYSELTTGVTRIVFTVPFGASDRITIGVLGESNDTNPIGWSTPETQYIVSDGSLAYTLTNSLQGTNRSNLIVTRNGIEARPSEGVGYIGDGVTTTFALPQYGNYDLALVADNDVTVYVNNQAQILGVNYFVDPTDMSSLRGVDFATAPAIGSTILISVRTKAQYWINGNQLVFQPAQGFIPVAGDIIQVTSFNDTHEQQILTQVFVGPTQTGTIEAQGYDDTLFDEGLVVDESGSFDFSTGIIISSNRFDLGFVITKPERLVVCLDGKFLFSGAGFTVSGTELLISGETINASQVVAVTSFTESVVPAAMAFRIFQDMRGLQTVYRITPDTTTTLTQPLLATDDVIYVDDVSKLSTPDLVSGIFGLITINGERIAYRNKNTVTNTVSGLRRGTAGTGAANHADNTEVYDIGVGNRLNGTYQNHIDIENFLADGMTTQFVTDVISVPLGLTAAVQVYVGGTLQTSGYTVLANNPVVVEFDQAPDVGYQVSIQVYVGDAWYHPGDGTPSNGIPLQYTDTPPARFLRGIA